MPTNDHSFQKRDRLRKRREFKETERKKCRAYGRYVIAYVTESSSERSRLGITVTKKIGHSPRRNWWKRRLREIFRLNRHLFKNTVDLVLIVRFFQEEERPLPTYAQLSEDVLQTVAKAIEKLTLDSPNGEEGEDSPKIN